MTEAAADEPTPAPDSTTCAGLAPGVLAARVTMLAAQDLAVSAGSLPVWDRTLGSRRRTWMSRLFFFVAWSVALALLTAAALRITCHDATVPLIWINAFTLYVYLPAYVILAVAIFRQRWLLAVVSTAVVVCHLVWVSPDFAPAMPYQPASAEMVVSRPVRILFANVLASNPDYQTILDEIAAAGPDVVTFAELHRPQLKRLMESSVMKSYDYGQRPGEVLILSKLPIQHQERKWVDGRICNMVDIPLDDVTLRLIALHSPRPLAEPARGYVNYWEKIISLLSEQPTPLVVVGDFNATQHSVVCKRLTSIGLRSAHEDRGRGYATTWPNGLWALPPIRIDQAFVSADVECLSIDEGTGTGSDHKPLIVDFRIHSPGRDETSRTAGR